MATNLMPRFKKIAGRILKILAKILIILFFLIIIILFLLQTSWVQDFGRKKIQSYLRSTLHTRVDIGKLSIDFPKKIIIQGIYLEDLQKDTLVFGGKLELDLNLWKLLGHTIELNKISLDRFTVKLKRVLPDSIFNYEFVVNAFSGKDKSVKKESDTAAAWQFRLGQIHLQHISAAYRDDAGGNDVYAYLEDFQTKVKTFDPAHQDYSIPEITVSGARGRFLQYQPVMFLKKLADTAISNSNGAHSLTLDLDKINLHAIRFDYRDEVSGTEADLDLGLFHAAIRSIDFSKMHILADQVQLQNSSLVMAIAKMHGPARAPKPNESAGGMAASTPWKFEFGQLDFQNNSIQYDDNNYKPLEEGMDYHHLRLSHAKIGAAHLILASEGYQGNIEEISFTEKSGFILKKISGRISMDNHSLQLDSFLIQTNYSLIRSQTLVRYDSLNGISKNPGRVLTFIELDPGMIAVKDILLLFPAFKSHLKGNENSIIKIRAKIHGQVKDVQMEDFELSGFGQTSIRIAGTIKGLPDSRKAIYSLRIKQLSTTSRDLQALIPPDKMPKSFRLPGSLRVSGIFNGSTERFHTKLDLQTSQGNLALTGFLDIPMKTYDLVADFRELNLGYFLKQDSLLGILTAHGMAQGTGFDYKQMSNEWQIQMKEAVYKGYTYRNLMIDGNLQNGAFRLNASEDDPNLRFSMKGEGRFSTKYPSLVMQLQLDTLNLHTLHLLKDTLALKLTLNADFANTDPDALQGHLKLYGIQVANAAINLNTDSVILDAEKRDSSEHIRLNAEMADLDWEGQFKITELPQALRQTLDTYYHDAAFKPEQITPQDWHLRALIRPSPLLLTYMPAWKGTDSMMLNIKFNSLRKDLQGSFLAPLILYGGQSIHGLVFSLATVDTALNYSLQVADAGKPGMMLHHTEIGGRLAHNELYNRIYLADSKRKDRYHLASRISKIPGGWKISILPDSLLLDYESWKVNAGNAIQYDSSGLLVRNLDLSHENETLDISSEEQSTGSPLHISFHHFKIGTLTSIAEQDSLFLSGILNGSLNIKDLMSNPLFTSDIHIQDLAYKKDTVGNVGIQISNKSADVLGTSISLEGHGNLASLNGDYFIGEKKLDMKMNFGRLNLGIIKPFAGDQIKDLKGYLKGTMAVKGSLSEPIFNGSIYFDSASIVAAVAGERWKLARNPVEFDEEGINFSKFTLTDSAGNQAVLDGNIYSKDFKHYRFDLSLSADNFRLINAPKSPNNPVYGRLNLDARIDLKGDLESPKANADLRVNKQTDLTLVLPSEDPEVVNRQGVVVFVDKKNPGDTARLRSLLDSLSRNSKLKGMDVAATIETDSNALFTVIIDERNGDALSLKGRADLAGGIDPSGKTSLTGNYELENGAYDLSLSVLKRKFKIQRGSTITWTGDPRKANIDITATYQVNAPSIDLVQQQISGRSAEEINKFKQKLPFQVNLKMTGELLKPVIRFEISLPPDQLSEWPEVDNKLKQIRTDESEVNKQVFALLLLNRFVSENPFVSASGSTYAETLAKQSASRILTDQVNQLAASLIKGVDLTIDLNSDKDYSSGQPINQTQLTVAVSKNLFSDRVRVSVGSNFQLEQTNPNQNASSIMGDVDVDYRLSKDGRYMLRAYRKDQYESVVEGQVVETGLSFILTFDYNQFYELFRNKKSERPAKKASQEKSTLNSNPGK